MCLLGIDFQTVPGNPLLVLANREEAFSRPATGPILLPAAGNFPAWLGGVDLLAGGTWLGINAHGLLAAVTNRRRSVVPIAPRSRGQLCRSLLAFRTVADASAEALRQLREGSFAGCNLLLATREVATVIEFGEELQCTPLSPGLHLITNAALNDPNDPRIARVRRELAQAARTSPGEWGLAAQRICMLRRDADLPAIRLDGPVRGTVSSTILTLSDQPGDSHFRHASFANHDTSYADYTSAFHGLIAGLTAPIGAHRIHLRGPWRFEPVAHALPDPNPAPTGTTNSLPSPGSARLPVPWRSFLGDFRGTAAFQRRFHRPNNLTAHDRVFVVLEGVIGSGHVALNGRALGAIDDVTHSFAADVTAQLCGNDELRVDLEYVVASGEAGACPPWQTAALEIRSNTGGH